MAIHTLDAIRTLGLREAWQELTTRVMKIMTPPSVRVSAAGLPILDSNSVSIVLIPSLHQLR